MYRLHLLGLQETVMHLKVDESAKASLLDIAVVGISHKTACVETRECFSFTLDESALFYGKLKESGIREAVYVSTCNRVEIYIAAPDISGAVNRTLDILSEFSGVSCHDNQSVYSKLSHDAARHLLTVISSLDSMVIGENEIVGQVKDAFAAAVRMEMTGVVLNKLFHQAFRTAKQVRSETDISRNPLSVAYIAVELVRRVYPDLSRQRALLIGAGEMGELILKYLTKFGIGEITIANRSLHNAERICREYNLNAHVTLLDDIERITRNVDIVITSVTAEHYIVTTGMAAEVMKARGGAPLLMIDIAVPRNIDPDVTSVADVYLYNVDDLRAIADENLKNRLSEMELAAEYIESNLVEFMEWQGELELTPTIVNLQRKFDEIRQNELSRFRSKKMKHLSDEDFALVMELTETIMNRTLHNPIMNLKRHQKENSGDSANSEKIRHKTKFVEELFIR